MYPRISKFFLKYSYASHLTHVPDHSSSYRLMLLNAEFPAGLWTKKHHSTSKIIQKNASVLFWSGSTDSDCLDFASLASAALRDFHRCVSNFRTSEGAVSVGDLQGIKSQLFMSGSGGFLGSFPFSQGETLIFS